MQFEHGYYILFMKNANSVHKNNTFLYIFTKPRLLNIVFLSLFPFIFLSKFKKYINFVVDVNICCTFQHIQLINVIFTYQTYRPHKQCLFMSALSNAKTSIDNEHIRLIHPDQCHYRNGDLVRIIEGDFKGIVGRVARVAGQQRKELWWNSTEYAW